MCNVPKSMTMTSKPCYPVVNIWPRAEPFAYGIFQVHPHPRLAVHNIKKLVTYAKSKSKGGCSKLSYPIWKHVACNKLQLTEDLAWVLFHTCLTMAATNFEKLKDCDEKLFNATSASEAEKIRNSQLTDLFTFVIFLYIQQINKISLRASAVSANAEWPGSFNRSSELDSGRSTPIRPCRNLDEQYHLQFVSENLAELLDLLVEPDIFGVGSTEAAVSDEAVEALNLILEGTVDQGRSLNSFSELVHMPAILPSTGYSKTVRAFNLRGLHSLIRSWLGPNPFSVENCIRNGRRLQWRLPHTSLWDNGVGFGNGNQQQLQQQHQEMIKRQKIASNAHQVPRTGGRNGNKLVVMSMISRQIIARSSATLDGATLKIHRAHCSYLYLLSPMRSVTLDKCRKLTIVLGPIENTLQLNHCEDCLIVAACRRCVLAACRRCTLHLAIQSRPILIQPPLPNAVSGTVANQNFNGPIAGSCTPTQASSAPGTPTPGGVALLGNEEILLAPFHTTYMRLVDHLNRVNLSPKVNYWDKPFLLGQDSSRQDVSQQHSSSALTSSGGGRCWDVLRPAHFYPFNIPLLLPTRTESLDRNSLGADCQIADGRTHLTPCNSLDLSAALITDTSRFFGDSEERRIENYISMANCRLPIPLPAAYLLALRERAAVYQKWPQHIANARLTVEQRHLFGTLVDQRFRQWLAESGNLRQLQLLELNTGHSHGSHTYNPNGQSDVNNVPPLNNPAVITSNRNSRAAQVLRSEHTTSNRSGSLNSSRNDRLRTNTNHDVQLVNSTC